MEGVELKKIKCKATWLSWVSAFFVKFNWHLTSSDLIFFSIMHANAKILGKHKFAREAGGLGVYSL